MKSIADLPVAETKSSSKSDVPVTAIKKLVSADVKAVVAEYNQTLDQIKALGEAAKSLGAYIAEQGLDYVMRHNCAHAGAPKEQIASVKFTDPLEDGQEQVGEPEIVLCSLHSAYLKFDKAQAEAMLQRIKTRRDGKTVNPNDYIRWALKAKFDTEVFYVDGKFDQARYDAFMSAVDDAAKKLKVECPLTCEKEIAVTEDFHVRRWTDFTATQNVALQKAIPAKVVLKAQRPQANGQKS